MSREFDLKELVAAAIALVIAGLTLWILYDLYGYASLSNADSNIFSRKKDVLGLVLALMGTVTGYYLGRAPAERQADAARKQAETATAVSSELTQKVNLIKGAVSDAASRSLKNVGVGPASPALDAVRDELQLLDQKVRNI